MTPWILVFVGGPLGALGFWIHFFGGKSGSHEHEWKVVAHIDGCHYFIWNYRCDCGASRSTYSERDVSFDSWSAVWMSDEGREDGPCARCAALMGGAESKHTDEIAEVPA